MIPHWVDNGGDPKAEWAGGLRVKPNVDAAWERGEIVCVQLSTSHVQSQRTGVK